MNAIEIPSAIESVLNLINWKKSSTSSRSATKGTLYPKVLTALIGNDQELASFAQNQLWCEIEDEDCVFPLTYDVADTLIRLLPLIKNEPSLKRLCKNLADIVVLPGLPHKKEKRFSKVLAETKVQLRLLEQFAAQHDDENGRAILHLLAKLDALTVVQTRMLDKIATPSTRAFAICVYVASGTQDTAERMLVQLRAALAHETDTTVRVILATAIVRAMFHDDEKSVEPDDEAIAVLIPYVLNPNQAQELFDVWEPCVHFLGNHPAHFVLNCVPYSIRLTQMQRLVDRLPNQDILTLADDLHSLCNTLFQEGRTTKLTPLHNQALLAIANVLDKHVNWVNHSEVLRNFDLPWKSSTLRQWVAVGVCGA
jgi:hypothetical protein